MAHPVRSAFQPVETEVCTLETIQYNVVHQSTSRTPDGSLVSWHLENATLQLVPSDERLLRAGLQENSVYRATDGSDETIAWETGFAELSDPEWGMATEGRVPRLDWPNDRYTEWLDRESTDRTWGYYRRWLFLTPVQAAIAIPLTLMRSADDVIVDSPISYPSLVRDGRFEVQAAAHPAVVMRSIEVGARLLSHMAIVWCPGAPMAFVPLADPAAFASFDARLRALRCVLAMEHAADAAKGTIRADRNLYPLCDFIVGVLAANVRGLLLAAELEEDDPDVVSVGQSLPFFLGPRKLKRPLDQSQMNAVVFAASAWATWLVALMYGHANPTDWMATYCTHDDVKEIAKKVGVDDAKTCALCGERAHTNEAKAPAAVKWLGRIWTHALHVGDASPLEAQRVVSQRVLERAVATVLTPRACVTTDQTGTLMVTGDGGAKFMETVAGLHTYPDAQCVHRALTQFRQE